MATIGSIWLAAQPRAYVRVCINQNIYHYYYQCGVKNRFSGITSIASIQVAVVTLHAWLFR